MNHASLCLVGVALPMFNADGIVRLHSIPADADIACPLDQLLRSTLN